jgi:hypothetical protein
MDAVSTIMLVCSISLSPGDCRLDTAAEVIRGADAPRLADCVMRGQATLAAAAPALAARGQYTRIVCVPSERADAVLRELALRKEAADGTPPGEPLKY